MAYRKLTLRRLPKHTRKLAKLINELESTTNRIKNLLPTMERLELDSNALFNKTLIQEALKTPINEIPELFEEETK